MLLFIGLFIFSIAGSALGIPEESYESCVTEKVPRCRKHEHYVRGHNQCPKTCGNRLVPGTKETCKPFTGCICDKGYVRRYDNGTGKCIPKKKCPRIPRKCGINEEPTSCRIKCPPQSCESIYTSYDCVETECEPGCDCINNYLRNSDGVCIPSEDCFKTTECGPNEVATDCVATCPPQSCDTFYGDYKCLEVACTPGCNCIDGYVRNSLGVCVPVEECANDSAGCNGDRNASHVRCGDVCPATCKEPDSNKPCIKICMLNGCKCKPGYIMNEKGGVCIDPKDCPGGSPTCGANETYVDCYFDCPTNYCPQSDTRDQVACGLPAYPCYGGCACAAGYLRVTYEDSRCVLASDCTPVNCTRPNEVWNPTPSNCFYERCEDRGTECNYDNTYPGPPRCVCMDGYYRNESDICVPASECPDQGCNGDPNATPNECPSYCPTTCENIYSKREELCIDACDPSGCVCKPGFILTKKGGVCVRPEDCPGDVGCNGDPNAMPNECPSSCPTTCDNMYNNIEILCIDACDPSGCVCKPGFILTTYGGVCVRPEECPVPECGPNEIGTNCARTCPPQSCDSLYVDYLCAYGPCYPGCNCIDGYLRNSLGVCVPIEECANDPAGCNGDRNATRVPCGDVCPATCAEPENNNPCPEICMLNGCKCKPGYIMSEKGGVCIDSKDCPGGSPKCGKNKTYVDCYVGCPTSFCPESDSRAQIACSVAYPCYGGCDCIPGYLRVSYEDSRCVLASECPPVNCTRPNEVWNPTPSNCFLERCEDRGAECNFDSKYPAPPRCVCKDGYYRNENDICVPASECPDLGCNGDPNAIPNECPSSCPPTCKNLYSERPEYCIDACDPSGCVCKPGFILTEKGGYCVKPEDCPVEAGCNGDLNATHTDCAVSCPVTCQNRFMDRRYMLCTQMCFDNLCVCKPDYILNEVGGICISPDDCPVVEECNGDPNAVYLECPGGCVTTCSDLNSEKPSVECPDVCSPGCYCKPGFVLKETEGICVRPEDCQVDQGCNGDLNATYAACTSSCPQTCENMNTDPVYIDETYTDRANPDQESPDEAYSGGRARPTMECIDMCDQGGCVCKPGFILTEKGGVCVKPEDCPVSGR